MFTARSDFSATLLPDGRVLVAGGNGQGQVSLASAEIFDPQANRWTAAPDMNDARIGHSATLLDDDRVFVFGGNDYEVTSAEIYDPTTDRWTTIPPLDAPEIEGHCASLLPNGDVLVTGGFDQALHATQHAFRYAVAEGEWHVLPLMNNPRLQHASVRLDDGRVLLAGGDGMDGSAAEVFDPDEETFTLVSPMNVSRGFATGIRTSTGVYVIGRASADAFDASTNEFRSAGALSLDIEYAELTAIDDGRTVLAVGGGLSPSALTDVFDASQNSWFASAPLPIPRSEHSVVTLEDGRVLALGGYSGAIIANVDVFTVAR
jgi:hypothetical protein